MEATAEGFGLLKEAICPPRLEDAGLEDCALPPEAIKEAFLKAADCVKSRVITDEDDDEGDGSCVGDPGPSDGEAPDALVGSGDLPTELLCGSVAGEGQGQGQGLAGDLVVASPGDIEGDASSDEVVVLGGEEEAGPEKACVGGDGVQKGEKEEKENQGEEEDGGGEEEKPTLTEALI